MENRAQNNISTLINLVRASVQGAELHLPDADWDALYDLVTRNGVTALTNDTAQRLPLPRPIALKWALSAENIEYRYHRELSAALHLTELYRRHDIRMMTMKGIALSRYYPQPERREFGDLDIWLMGDYERGNTLFDVNCDHPKHSNFKFEGIEVENHRLFSRNTAFNDALLELLAKYGTVEQGGLIFPPPQFEALHIIFHAANHFGAIGVPLRHVLDWGLLLRQEREHIDLNEIRKIIRRVNLTRLFDAMTLVAGDLVGENFADLLFEPKKAPRRARILLNVFKKIKLRLPDNPSLAAKMRRQFSLRPHYRLLPETFAATIRNMATHWIIRQIKHNR